MSHYKNIAISSAGCKKSKKITGFTLLEIMVVVVIIAVMAAAVGPALLGNINKANVSRAKTDISSIQSMVDLYKAENYQFPSTDQGLEALVAKPSGDPTAKNWRQYMKKTPMDPWENPYKYLSPGAHGDYDIYSLGDDGVQSDDDINSWDLTN